MSKHSYKPTSVDGLYRRGERLYIVATIGGQRVRRPARVDPGASPATQLQQAKAELAKLQADAAKRKLEDTHGVKRQKRHLWAEACKKYLLEVQNRRSIQIIAGRVLWLEESELFEGKYVDEIDREMILEVYRARRAMGNQPKTALHSTDTVRAILRRAMNKWHWISQVPTVDMEDFHGLESTGKSAFNNRRERTLTDQEEKRLLAEVCPHWRPIIQYALLTGQRQANILNLRWEQIDMSGDTWIVRVSGEEMKNGNPHEYPLSDDAREIVESQIGKCETHVFSYKGKPIRNWTNKTWQAACRRAGIDDFRFHDLRHTFATRMVAAGCPIEKLAKLGPWEIKVLLKVYYNPKSSDLADYVNLLKRAKGEPKLKVVNND
jgi:integrase